MACETFRRVAARIDSYKDQIIELQRQLVAIPAIDPACGGTGEAAKARYLQGYLKDLGFEQIRVINSTDPDAEGGVRPNLVCTIPGEVQHPVIWLMSHMDVVPAGDLSKWDTNPFELKVDGDKLIGRGTEDNHQGLVASIMVAQAFKEEGITPKHSIGLLLVADEETGSAHGIAHVLKQNPQLFNKDDLIIVPDGGLPDGSQIEVAEKGILWIKFVVTGKQCHASMPYKGVNAMRAGAYLVTMLDSLQGDFPDEDMVFDPPHSTFEPTRKDANVPNVNTIPGEDAFYIDCRVLPQYELDQVIERVKLLSRQVEERFGVKVAMSFPQKVSASQPTSVDAPVVVALKQAVRQVYAVEARAEGIGGGTVAAEIRKLGFPVAVWARMEETMHSPNEFSLISNIIGDAKVFAHVICGC